MEGNNGFPFRKRPNPQFKRKGGNKKGKWHNSSREESSGNIHPVDTVYRILCPSKKIGSVIGKGGTIVKALREETQAKITVADSVPNSGERVIIIYSPPMKIPTREESNEDSGPENEEEGMESHCPAQEALLKVHQRIIEDDLFGGISFEDDTENNAITARLLVPNNMVGCLLGKGGDVIQKLRSETGANIRVLPEEHLPSCAMNTDELVQISGIPLVVKRALYEVSTLLHLNPRKDQPPLSFPMPFAGQHFPPPGGPMWPHQTSNSPGMPPMPWREGYGNQPSGFMPGGMNDVPPGHGGGASGEFSMKILCSAGKIGGVIGKGGFNVKQLQQETGASIHVEDESTESEERVIRVSAFETPWNPTSQTIEAILQLQNKTSEYSDKGKITTRLLVPSSKVGCLLGQGGQVINEMRRRTQADIRVYSKDDKPKCASDDEELVQISAIFVAAKDALAEIASRLRMRTLRDANAGVEPPPVGPVQGYARVRSLPGRGPPPSGGIGAGSSGRYERIKGGGHEYEPLSYPVPPAATGYPTVNNSMEPMIRNNAMGSLIGTGRSSISGIGEVAGARVRLQDPQAGASECVVEIRGSSEHLTATQGILQAYMTSSEQNASSQRSPYRSNAQQGSSYQSMNAQQGSYQSMNAQIGSYQSLNAQQGSYQSTNAQLYQGMNSQQDPYQSMIAQPSPYESMIAQQGSYQNASVPHGSYPQY